jgi:Domain of unknown function (DUF4272)
MEFIGSDLGNLIEELSHRFSRFTMLNAPDSNFQINARHPFEVAQRVLAILAVLDRACANEAAPTRDWVFAYNIDRYFSDAERDFYFETNISHEEREDFGWLSESLPPMLWALGYLEDLPPLNKRFELENIPYLYQITHSTAQFLADACLRHSDAIGIAEEQLCQTHWRAIHAESSTQLIDKVIDADIIYERRYAISWLVGWGENWDNVPIDSIDSFV